MKLLISALTKFLCGLLLVGLLLFLPAGTLAYPGGWRLIGILFAPMFLLGVVLLIKSPSLLEKRLDSKEKAGTQKGVVGLSALLFITGFVVAGLDFRFGWSYVSTPVIIAAAVVFLLAYGLYAEVMRENAYLSRTVQVQEGQHVVDTGLYAIVRHPMYTATILLFWAMPLLLGSWWAALCLLPFPLVLAVRILDEERLLAQELEGYTAYQQKVKYRLIPLIW